LFYSLVVSKLDKAIEDYFEISLGHGADRETFKVKDYTLQEGDKCKFEVFRLGTLILSLKVILFGAAEIQAN
jgi:hypothetical protein